MTTGEKIGLGIAIVLILGLIVFFGGIAAKWWNNPFSSTASDYDKCVADNKAKAEGSECTNCIPEGSQQANFKGRIRNGECVQEAQPPVQPPAEQAVKLRVSNPKGAVIYDRAQNGTFSPRANTTPIPANTELVALYSDGIAPMYYGIRMGGSDPTIRSFTGWVNSNDVQQRA